jgi:glycosyltransferase involved in cell wall biosynthesis
MLQIDELIVLTKHFPFNTLRTPGESFLTNEIEVLARKATRVIVFAGEATARKGEKAPLPGNVEAHPLSLLGTRADKLVCMIGGLRYFLAAPEKVRNERKGKPFSAKCYLNYFCARGEQKLRRIQNVLGKMKLGRNILIYSYWCYDHAYAAVELKRILSDEHEVTCFSRAHRYDLYEYNHRFRNGLEYIPLRPWLFERLNHIYPCSEDGTRYLAQRYPGYRDVFRTAYIGTSDCGVQDAPRRENLRVVSCSQLIPVKRVERLISALALLTGKGMRVSWIHFGGGAKYESLVKLAKRRLTGCEWRMPGRVDNRDILRFYAENSVDVFVNVSESEGLPISIMEAISFGIPVIATDVGGTSEIVSDGINGYLLKKDFADDELCTLLERIFAQTPEERARMRGQARQMWLARFECERNVLSLLENA